MAASRTDSQAVSHGVTLFFEDLDGPSDLPRLRPADQTLVRVVAGRVALSIDGVVRVLGAGEEAIVAAGACHWLESIAGPARILTGFRPVGR